MSVRARVRVRVNLDPNPKPSHTASESESSRRTPVRSMGSTWNHLVRVRVRVRVRLRVRVRVRVRADVLAHRELEHSLRRLAQLREGATVARGVAVQLAAAALEHRAPRVATAGGGHRIAGRRATRDGRDDLRPG